MNLITAFSRGLTRNYESVDGSLKPTVYADYGPAIYNDLKGGQYSTISSKTGFKNLLEDTIIESPGTLIEGLDGLLPHLLINKTSSDYTSGKVTSIEIPHRLGSAWFLGINGKLTGSNGKEQRFVDIFLNKAKEVGIPAAVGYFCPNTLLHGYMLTAIEGINTHVSKRPTMISGGIKANRIVKERNAGVSFDPVLVSASKVESINGLDPATGKPPTKTKTKAKKESEDTKLSSQALGNILISNSYLVSSDDVKLYLSINYRAIQKMPVDPALKELIVDLANFQAAKLLSENIDVRVDTMLRPSDGEYDKYNADEMLDMVISSCKKCIELGVVNPDIVTSFDIDVKIK